MGLSPPMEELLDALGPGRDGRAAFTAMSGWSGSMWPVVRAAEGPALIRRLFQLVRVPGNGNREHILRLIGEAASTCASEWPPRRQPVERSLWAGLPTLARLVSDTDPSVRRLAPYVICRIVGGDAGRAAAIRVHAAAVIPSHRLPAVPAAAAVPDPVVVTAVPDRGASAVAPHSGVPGTGVGMPGPEVATADGMPDREVAAPDGTPDREVAAGAGMPGREVAAGAGMPGGEVAAPDGVSADAGSVIAAGPVSVIREQAGRETDGLAFAGQLRALDETDWRPADGLAETAAGWFASWLDHPCPEARMAAAGAVARLRAGGRGAGTPAVGAAGTPAVGAAGTPKVAGGTGEAEGSRGTGDAEDGRGSGAAAALGDVVAGVLRAGGGSLWADSPWARWSRHGVFAGSLAERVADDDPEQGERLALTLLAEDRPGWRGMGLTAAAAVLDRWRLPMPRLWKAIAEGLRDDDYQVRSACAELFVLGGRAGANHTAALASAAGGEDGAAFSAAAALALLGDVRALPVVERRIGDRRFWNPPGAEVFGELLTPLRGHADRLLPGIRAALRDKPGESAPQLLPALAAWGPASAPALPELTALLGTEHAAGACRALGHVGPAAGPVAGDLRDLALGRRRPPANDPSRPAAWHGRQQAAWAHWQITGDPEVALAVLGRAVRRGPGHAVLRYLAQLGPLAIAHAVDVRELMAMPGARSRVGAAYAWWRITGEPDPALPVLRAVVEPLCHSTAGLLPAPRSGPLIRRAVVCLGEFGAAADAALPLLSGVVSADRRYRDPVSRRPIVDDEALLDAADAAVARVRAARDVRDRMHGTSASEWGSTR